MPRYFRRAALKDSFYGQPVKSTSMSPVSEFEIIGLSSDFVTAARIALTPEAQRYPATIHVFSRHTGTSSCGWAHVSTFSRSVNRAARFQAAIIAGLLTLVAACVLITLVI